jgi:hypothetical protein
MAKEMKFLLLKTRSRDIFNFVSSKSTIIYFKCWPIYSFQSLYGTRCPFLISMTILAAFQPSPHHRFCLQFLVLHLLCLITLTIWRSPFLQVWRRGPKTCFLPHFNQLDQLTIWQVFHSLCNKLHVFVLYLHFNDFT